MLRVLHGVFALSTGTLVFVIVVVVVVVVVIIDGGDNFIEGNWCCCLF